MARPGALPRPARAAREPGRRQGLLPRPGGKTDPAAELEATLAAFFGGVPEGERAQHPQCRFPARYLWLKGRLAFDPARLPERDCPRFEEWRRAIDASAATLVFASAYLNNPGSMYGHTFLRLKRRGALPGEDLLDYTVNFAGEPDTANGFLYAVKGIFGFFPGGYSTLPYDMKIREYTDLESRDLWEYDLSLSTGALDRLVRHAWEMGSTHFDYYFFTENCSYQLLTLLDGAEPSLALAGDFPAWAIPADTVRAVLARPGLVSAVRHRPSLVSQMKARRARLTGAERRLAARLGRGAPSEGLAGWGGLAAERRALVLDSAHDLLSYRHGLGPQRPEAAKAAERRLLVERGRLGLASPETVVAAPSPPHEGHRSARLTLGAGAARRGPYLEAGFRGALHDLVAPDAGYPSDSELEMGDVVVRGRPRDGKAWLERVDAVSIVSLSPWDSWVRKPSWRVSGGVDQAKEEGCREDACMILDLAGGGGLAVEASALGRHTAYVLAVADLGAGPALRRDWRAGAGGTAGLLLRAGPLLRAHAEATYIHYPRSPDRQSLKAVASLRLARDFELRAHGERRVPESEAGASLSWHF